jgi:hypothetical protein
MVRFGFKNVEKQSVLGRFANTLSLSFGAFNTQTLVVDATIAVHSAAKSAFLDQYHIVPLTLFSTSHTGKFLSHFHSSSSSI